MKRLILACGLLGAIATAQAGPDHHPGRPPMDAQHYAERLKNGLQLNDEQTAKVKKILESGEQQRKTLMDKYKPQFDAFHAESRTLREQTNTQIDAVLTPKQKVAYKELVEAREGLGRRLRVPGSPNDEGPSAPPERPE